MLGQSGAENVPVFAGVVELIGSLKFLCYREHSQKWLCHWQARRLEREVRTVFFHKGTGIVASRIVVLWHSELDFALAWFARSPRYALLFAMFTLYE
jgi:hypothetical protein